MYKSCDENNKSVQDLEYNCTGIHENVQEIASNCSGISGWASLSRAYCLAFTDMTHGLTPGDNVKVHVHGILSISYHSGPVVDKE